MQAGVRIAELLIMFAACLTFESFTGACQAPLREGDKGRSRGALGVYNQCERNIVVRGKGIAVLLP